jgi:hypothetical protein
LTGPFGHLGVGREGELIEVLGVTHEAAPRRIAEDEDGPDFGRIGRSRSRRFHDASMGPEAPKWEQICG